MADKTIFIFGASRGLGLGMVEEFASRGWSVIASERARSDALHALGDKFENLLRIVTADITDPVSYAELGLGSGTLDALFLNAGITGARHQSCEQATAEEVAEVMMTNAFGPARAAKTLLPAVKEGGTIAFMTSLMGSIGDSSGGYELYRTSKTALNMLAKGIAMNEAKERNLAVLAMHPGWVQTDMGGAGGTLTVAQSVTGLADVIEDTDSPGFRYVDYAGKDLPF